MRHLHVIGFTSDHGGLILAGKRGAQTGSYILALDEHVLAQIEQARQAAGEEEAPAPVTRPARSHEQSGLTPREIQARLRAGRTVEEVAAEAGVSIDWVDRFAAPVLAEQAAAVGRAQAATLQTARRGASDRTLAASVLRNLAERGVTLTSNEIDTGWSARHLVDGEWLVTFRFRSRGRMLAAEWILAGSGSSVTARNRLATELGFVEAGRPATVPVEAAVAPPSARPARKAPVARTAPAARRAGGAGATQVGKAPLAERASAARTAAGSKNGGREPAAASKARAAGAVGRGVPAGKKATGSPAAARTAAAPAPATQARATQARATQAPGTQAPAPRVTAGRNAAAAKPPGSSGQARKLVPAKVLVSRKAAGDRPAPIAAAASTDAKARKVTVKAVPAKATAVKGPAVKGPAVKGPAVKGPAVKGPAVKAMAAPAPARPAVQPGPTTEPRSAARSRATALPEPTPERPPAGVPGVDGSAGLVTQPTGSQGAVPQATPSRPAAPARPTPARPTPAQPTPAQPTLARERPLRADRPLRAERTAPQAEAPRPLPADRMAGQGVGPDQPAVRDPAPGRPPLERPRPAPDAVRAGPAEVGAEPAPGGHAPVGRHFARPRPDAADEAHVRPGPAGPAAPFESHSWEGAGSPAAVENGSQSPRLSRLGRRVGRPLRANRTESALTPDEDRDQPGVAASVPVTAQQPVVDADRPGPERPLPERPAAGRPGPERPGDASPWAGPVPSGRPVIRAQPVTGDLHRDIDPPGDDRFRPSP